MAISSARMRDCSSLHFAEISPRVIAVELLGLPAGKTSLLCASRSFSLRLCGGTERSLDLFSRIGGVDVGLAPFVSDPEAERLECTSAKAALQQTAAKKKTRPVRAKADMIERPCFRNFSRVFPIIRLSCCCSGNAIIYTSYEAHSRVEHGENCREILASFAVAALVRQP